MSYNDNMAARLTRISRLKMLRNFIDFESSLDLKKHEVFYAPNGSGKTNLTRILQTLRDGHSIDQFKSREASPTDVSELELTIDSSIITHLNYNEPENHALLESMIIFNSDYVSENITVPDFRKDLDGDVVLELGKEDADIKELERKINDERIKIARNVTTLKSSIDIFIKNLKNKTYKATEHNIWSELKLDNVLDIKADEGMSSIDADAMKAIVDDDYSKTPQERIELLLLEGAEKINLSTPTISKLDLSGILDALVSAKEFPSSDQEISDNVKFLATLLHDHLAYGKEPNIVIKAAIVTSEEKDKCILCKRVLDDPTKELFTRYKAFFAGEKAEFEEKLRTYTKEVDNLIAAIESATNDKRERVNQLAELFGVKSRWQDVNTSKVLNDLGSLKLALETKQKSISIPKKVSKIDKLEDHIDALTALIASNKKLADSLDIKSNDVATNLSIARRKVGRMELANFITQNKSIFEALINSSASIATLKLDLKAKQDKAPKMSVRKNTSELFNYFMSDRIGIDKYQSEIINDQMVIKLREFDISDSTNLISDGEQTIIGLAYFLASSISRLSDFDKFSNAIFIIDDPVSSVSYSNLFGISSLLKRFDGDIKQKLWGQNPAQVSVQTVVLTHNIQFLNIMKTHIWKDIKRDKNHYGIIDSCSLRDIKVGRLLSEFQSALLSIYRESQERTSGLNVCNDIRRVTETLRHFYGLKEDFTAESMKKIFPYIEGKEYDNIFSTINHFSHGSPEDPDMLPPDIVDSAIAEFVEIIGNKQSPFVDLWDETKLLEGVS